MDIIKLIEYLEGRHKIHTQEHNKHNKDGNRSDAALALGKSLAVTDVMHYIVEELEKCK